MTRTPRNAMGFRTLLSNEREAGMGTIATIAAVLGVIAALVGIPAAVVEVISYIESRRTTPTVAPSPPPSSSIEPSAPASPGPPGPTATPAPTPTPEPVPDWTTVGQGALISGRGFEVLPEIGVGPIPRTAFVCDRCPRQLCGWGCRPYGEDYTQLILRLPPGTRGVAIKAGLDSFRTATEDPLEVTVALDGEVVGKEVVGPSQPLSVSVSQKRPMARLLVQWMGVESRHVLMMTRPRVTTDTI